MATLIVRLKSDPRKSKRYIPNPLLFSPNLLLQIRQANTGSGSKLLNSVQSLIIPHIHRADFSTRTIKGRSALLEQRPPEALKADLELDLPEESGGKDGLMVLVEKVLRFSVNTWDQGFLDKLYASTNAVGHI